MWEKKEVPKTRVQKNALLPGRGGGKRHQDKARWIKIERWGEGRLTGPDGAGRERPVGWYDNRNDRATVVYVGISIASPHVRDAYIL
jgi:hypothetical protein